jgi:hypothetical protein
MSRLPKLAYWQWIVLVVILALAADWIVKRPDHRTRDVNAAIDARGSDRLKHYPYRFRAVRVDGESAVLTTPRNFHVPAFRFIGAIHPEINVKNPNDPAFIAAQTELGLVQSEVAAIAAAQPGIRLIQWELDKSWLAGHGIEVQP